MKKTINNIKGQAVNKSIVTHEELEVKVEVIDSSDLRKYRTELPNIIFELGLNPYQFRVYCQLKKIAGQNGACWYSNTKLAALCGMKQAMFRRCKNELQQNFELLGNKPLITIKNSKKQDGNNATSLINIADIWPENFVYMAGIKKSSTMPPGGRGVCHDMAEVCHQVAPKKEPYIKEPIEELPSLKVSPETVEIPKKKSSKSKKKKPRRSIQDAIQQAEGFSEKVLEFSATMIKLIHKHNKMYRPPKDMIKFYQSVEEIIEVDKQDEHEILKVFEWGVSDTEKRKDFPGWKGFITGDTKKNPAGYFYDRFTLIQSQMNSRPKRKFAASSNSESMDEMAKEMNSRAL